jgi:hypothetical protein
MVGRERCVENLRFQAERDRIFRLTVIDLTKGRRKAVMIQRFASQIKIETVSNQL